jgi:hypothetical protein
MWVLDSGPLGSHIRQWEVNFKLKVREISCEDMNWFRFLFSCSLCY